MCSKCCGKLVKSRGGTFNLIPIGHSACFWFSKWIHESHIGPRVYIFMYCIFRIYVYIYMYIITLKLYITKVINEAFILLLLLLKTNFKDPKVKPGASPFASMQVGLFWETTLTFIVTERWDHSFLFWNGRIHSMLGRTGLLGLTSQESQCRKCPASRSRFTPGQEELQFWAGSRGVIWSSWRPRFPGCWREGPETAWVVLVLARVAGQSSRHSRVTHQTFPAIPPKASPASACQTWLVYLHSNCCVTFKFHCPLWDLQSPD